MNWVRFRNLQRGVHLPAPAFRRLVQSAMADLEVRSSGVTVIYCSPSRIRDLNREYRQKDEPTDVLAFPDGQPDEEGTTYLGDIFIAPAVALENARRHETEPALELATLHVHGLLHLLGYDHETDSGRMLKRQDELMARLRPRIPDIPPAE